jgi:hypothetical protein
MLGKRPDQRGLFEADTQYLETVGKESFYGFLAGLRGTLFRDDEFASLYHAGIGRPSVPPSLLATALLLQTHDRVSDQEAKERADFDVRWKVALGIPIETQPFAKSTLQLFRAQLVVHEQGRQIFQKSLALARQQGYLKKDRRLRLALDTTNILGRGAVKDTYNLLADGIVLVLRQLAKLAGSTLEAYAGERGLGRYVSARSIKGEAELDWDNPKERQRLLREIVGAADGLIEEVRKVRASLVDGSVEDAALKQAAERLSQVLLQDIERTQEEDGPLLHEGVAKDRMPSVHDPQMRHGRKSAHKRFDGHKAQIAVDTESQIITAVAVLAGNAPDNEGALALVNEAETNSEATVAETIADCAFGDGATRQQFAAAGRTLVAKVPATTNRGCFPKTAFAIDLEAQTCTCPAGQAGVARYGKAHRESNEHERKLRGFQFAAQTCAACPLRPQCVRGRGGGGRSIAIHAQEALLQQARALQRSPAFHTYKLDRQVVEHRLARLVQLGIRQARYFGRTKTLFQLLMAATVANLTLLAFSQGTHQGTTAPLGGLLTILIVSWALQGRADTRQSGPGYHTAPPLPHRRQHIAFSQSAAGAAKMAPSRPHF